MSVANKYEADRLAAANTSNTNTTSTASGGVSLESIKKALIMLQQQTKTAVDGMLKRLDAQNKERSKLEFVMRDMKRCLKEEQQHREILQSDIKILQSQYRVRNKNEHF
jgi:DNA-binding transcriptional MerR regulator